MSDGIPVIVNGSTGSELPTNKDQSNGYVGLTLLKINFKNVLNTFTSFFTNSNTASRTYTFPDKDGVIATIDDLGDGWIPLTTCTYETTDTPTFQLSVAADVTGKITVGSRIRLTQTTVKYFIVTAVGTYGAGKTVLTVYGGTDYTLVNAAITSPSFSIMKAPLGFPLNTSKWDWVFKDTVNTYSAGSTNAGVWYYLLNGASQVKLDVPIGLWELSYQGMFSIVMSSGSSYVLTTLSTTAGELSPKYTSASYLPVLNTAVTLVNTDNVVLQTAKTTWYLYIQSFLANCTSLQAVGLRSGIQIRAKCLYL